MPDVQYIGYSDSLCLVINDSVWNISVCYKPIVIIDLEYMERFFGVFLVCFIGIGIVLSVKVYWIGSIY